MPYMDGLPKREKSKLAKLWDHVREVKRITEEKGTLLPQHLVADILNLSKQRISQLIDDGRLEAVEVHGVRYVTAASVQSCAQVERVNGRHIKKIDNQALWKSSVASAQEIVEKTSK